MNKIKVLVVEDSLLFREFLVHALESDKSIEVVATANDPFEARDAILKYAPDVMTLDVEMPRMNGVEFLRQLLPQYNMPVVMVSSINESIFNALDAGAIDFINKPSHLTGPDIDKFIKNELIPKVKAASMIKPIKVKPQINNKHLKPIKNIASDKRLIAIGASTGGTEAILSVVKKFNTDVPGIVIVQHMPPGFTEMYANRLDKTCKISAKEAKTGDIIKPGLALIAPGDAHMSIYKDGTNLKVKCSAGPKVNGHCPSVDVLFNSVAEVLGNKAIGIILTGMGADGVKGLFNMKSKGAETIGQDAASCIVYGMPKVAYEVGAVKYQITLEGIADKVYQLLSYNNFRKI